MQIEITLRVVSTNNQNCRISAVAITQNSIIVVLLGAMKVVSISASFTIDKFKQKYLKPKKKIQKQQKADTIFNGNYNMVFPFCVVLFDFISDTAIEFCILFHWPVVNYSCTLCDGQNVITLSTGHMWDNSIYLNFSTFNFFFKCGLCNDICPQTVWHTYAHTVTSQTNNERLNLHKN